MDGGFFSKEETGHGQQLARLTGCAACGLNKQCSTPKMEPGGRGEKRILIVSEIPCKAEDEAGRLFVGEASSFLKKCLKKNKVDMVTDCRKIAAVSCRTPGGRAPTSNEVAHCRPRVMKEIEQYKPHIILLLGNAAVESVIGSVWKKDLGGITKWRGFRIPDIHFGAWLCPVFHPSYVLKCDKEPAVEVIWQKDVKRALRKLDKHITARLDDSLYVTIIDDNRALTKRLDGIMEWETLITIDFETTGLKPDAPVQELVSCSISTAGDNAFSFDWPKSGPALRRLQKLFADPKIGKIAQNIKFEDRWAAKFGAPISGWRFDTMLASHMLDNRSYICGLKFQVYVNFGVADYDSSIEHYLKSAEDGAHAVNTIRKAPRRERLVYNGLDTMYTHQLAEIQMASLGKGVPVF